MMIKRSLIFMITFIIFPVLLFAQDQRKELSKEEIIQIAIKEMKEMGDNLEQRTIIYDEGNKLWNEKLKTIDKKMAPDYEFLKDKNYQVVCFSLKEGVFVYGGDIWFFIDKTTGEVLTSYGEQ